MIQGALAGAWSLRDVSGQHTCPISFPGDGISALYDAGLIPDPYWGRNEYDLRWISQTDWVATRDFDLDDPQVDLLLSEVDCVVTVRVNDTVVLRPENAFRSYRVPLGDVATRGRNTITVTFHSPVLAGKAKYDAHPFEIPWSENCPIPYGNFLRKPACDFGWDWNIALAPFGIYGALDIVPSNAARIDRIAVHQVHAGGTAALHVTPYVSHYDGPVSVTFDGQTVTVGSGETAVITVENPDLWWPVGQGEQPLYPLQVTAGAATQTRRIGLRDLQLVTEPDDDGLGFKFRINGRDVFCKGANWIPADALPGRITDAKTRALLQSAVDANMNMIRIWGGGRYEPTSFYDTCDEMGLLVWQDFMFACNLYPSDRAYLAEVRAEIADNVARMHHHACIALWCGDNELVGSLTWYDVARQDRDRYLVNYDRLNRAVEDALFEADPHANWWPSSPSAGPLNFGDAWHDDGSGDMHFWSVWHEGRDFDHYRDVAPRFCSEFGFQSYPQRHVIDQFAGEADRNIAAPVLESHQKNAGGNARIAETMFRYFRWPAAFDDFVYLSQIQQGLAIKTAVTHWRANKPRCMGTIIWQLNDTWPVCSWSSLDYGGDWKLMHHMAQDFYAPVMATAVPKEGGICVRAVNDGPAPTPVTVTVEAVALSGARRPLDQCALTVAETAHDVLQLTPDALAADELLLVSWTSAQGNGREVYAPRPYKTYDLLPSDCNFKVTRDGDDYVLTLQSAGLGLFVAVEAGCSGRFIDNVFDILPGETVTTCFTPTNPDDTPNFVLRDLHSATTA